MRYALLAAEGSHDQAAIGRLLELAGMQRFDGKPHNLDPFWQKCVPVYPSPHQRLYVRLDMPSIYQTEELSVAVYQGEGTNLVSKLKAILINHKPYQEDLDAFGMIVDADTMAPDEVAKKVVPEFRPFFPDFSEGPGEVSGHQPRTGLYILPDNANQGTLDTLLVKCADIVYADLKTAAEAYLSQVDGQYKSRWRPFDEPKALVATVTSVLKPGLTNTASIAQNDWICERSVAGIAELASLRRFLGQLLEGSLSSAP